MSGKNALNPFGKKDFRNSDIRGTLKVALAVNF